MRRVRESLSIEVTCEDLPGTRFETTVGGKCVVYEPVLLGIQCRDDVLDAMPAEGGPVLFRPVFEVAQRDDGAPGFFGPYAKGTPPERFFYLSWVVRTPFAMLSMFRRAKIHLNHLTWQQIRSSIESGQAIRVRIAMTDQRGGPLCASVRSDVARWEI